VKAAYLLDQSCNIVNAPDFYRDVAVPVFKDGDIVEWTIPKGTIVEGDEALLRVHTGQAAPVDDECAEACGMNPRQLAVNQRAYLAANRGIRGKKDFELFMAEVIEGYGPDDMPEKTVYEPGKNYQKWLDAKAKLAKKDDDE
jgi:hypothetical protein